MTKKDIKTGIIESPVGNYYGTAHVYKENGKFYFHVEDWDDNPNGVEVSKEFYNAFKKEFKKEKK